jgi:hypothetical protein
MVRSTWTTAKASCLLRIRKRWSGRQMKIVVSLDSHANVTTQMLSLADGLVAYRTYPHIDMADTGRRAAELLLALDQQRQAGAPRARRVPFLIPVNSMSTMMQPARGMYDLLEGSKPACSRCRSRRVSRPPTSPSAAPWCGATASTRPHRARHVDALFSRICHPEHQWAVRFEEPDAAVLRAMQVAADGHAPGDPRRHAGQPRRRRRFQHHGPPARPARTARRTRPSASSATRQPQPPRTPRASGAWIDIGLGGCPQVRAMRRCAASRSKRCPTASSSTAVR